MVAPILKYTNALYSGYSYIYSAITRNQMTGQIPIAIGIELTNHCNLNCIECYTGSGMMKREKGFMSLDLFDKIINEIGPSLFNINLYFQGESMLHPKFFTFLKKAKGIHSTVSTNGHFIDRESAEKILKSKLKKLIISLDGMDQETYSGYRVNGNLATVLSGLQHIAEARKKISSRLKIEIQFIVNRLNESQIGEARRFCSESGFTLKLKSMQVINSYSHSLWIPSNDNFSRYRKHNEKYEIKNELPNRCARLWFNPVVTWDGKVLPCCFDKDASHIMGDLNEDTFKDIWEGPRYRLFRRSILTDRDSIDICTNCTSGIRNVSI